jgi:hypothetical protein
MRLRATRYARLARRRAFAHTSPTSTFAEHVRRCIRRGRAPVEPGGAIFFATLSYFTYYRYFCARSGLPRDDSFTARTPRELAWYFAQIHARSIPVPFSERARTIHNKIPFARLSAMYRVLRRNMTYAELIEHAHDTLAECLHCGLCDGPALRTRLRAAERSSKRPSSARYACEPRLRGI